MLSYLAAPRMAAISRFFHAASDDHQLGAYAWTQAVAAALWPVMGDFEVSLRNAIHRALSLHYGEVESFDWMCQRPNCALSVKAKMLPAWHCMSKRQQTDIEKSREQVKCRIPSDHIPIRSWPLFLARELMRDLIETLKAEQST